MTRTDVFNNYICLADGDGGLRIINIANPYSPFETGYCNTPGEARGVAVSGIFAYVAAKDTGLRIINITDTSSPFEAGYCDTPGEAYGVAVSGDYAYVADGTRGLQIVYIGQP